MFLSVLFIGVSVILLYYYSHSVRKAYKSIEMLINRYNSKLTFVFILFTFSYHLVEFLYINYITDWINNYRNCIIACYSSILKSLDRIL